MPKNITKIKDFFKNLDHKKLRKAFVVTICILVCCLSITFANNFFISRWFIVMPIFVGLILLFTIIYIILYYKIKKQQKTENDLKIEQVLEQRRKLEKEEWQKKSKEA